MSGRRYGGAERAAMTCALAGPKIRGGCALSAAAGLLWRIHFAWLFSSRGVAAQSGCAAFVRWRSRGDRGCGHVCIWCRSARTLRAAGEGRGRRGRAVCFVRCGCCLLWADAVGRRMSGRAIAHFTRLARSRRPSTHRCTHGLTDAWDGIGSSNRGARRAPALGGSCGPLYTVAAAQTPAKLGSVCQV